MNNRGSFTKWLCVFCVLIYLGWYQVPALSFIAFIPFFVVMEMEVGFAKKIFFLAVLFFAWNLIITYWLCQINFLKGILLIILNTVLMASAIAVGLWLRSAFLRVRGTGFIIILIIWLGFEHLHYIWPISWPWLTIGNIFSRWPALVQWYSITGPLGGTIWILLSNYFIYQLFFIKTYHSKRKKVYLYSLLFLIALPVSISLYVYFLPSQKVSGTYRVGVIHTNYHSPALLNEEEKIRQLKSKILSNLDSNVDLIIIPELFLNDIFSKSFNESVLYTTLKSLTTRCPRLKIITGATLIEENPDGNIVYSAFSQNVRVKKYNVSVSIDSSDHIPVKEKKALIPFEEHIPGFLSFIPYPSENYSFDDDNSDSFYIDSTSSFLNLICYEAINSVFVASRIRSTDQFIVMLASESFFMNASPGMEQYLNYCRLRSIETGKYLIKSSNEGISAIIDDKGNIVKKCNSVSYQYLSSTIRGTRRYTLFSQYGDWIGRSSSIISILLMILAAIKLPSTRRPRRNPPPITNTRDPLFPKNHCKA